MCLAGNLLNYQRKMCKSHIVERNSHRETSPSRFCRWTYILCYMFTIGWVFSGIYKCKVFKIPMPKKHIVCSICPLAIHNDLLANSFFSMVPVNVRWYPGFPSYHTRLVVPLVPSSTPPVQLYKSKRLAIYRRER